MFLSHPACFSYAVCESCGTCNERQVFSHTQGLIMAFCSVLVKMYLNIVINYFSTLISQISLVHEKTVIGKITWAAKLLLFRFFMLKPNFFLNFLICLMKLIRVSVMLCLKENQNMVLMIFAHILEKLVCFNFSCLVVVLLILLKDDDKKIARSIGKTH